MSASSVAGAKQLQAKMALMMTDSDEKCAKRVLRVWEEMVSTTVKRAKTDSFQDLEDYIDYRIIDTGAP